MSKEINLFIIIPSHLIGCVCHTHRQCDYICSDRPMLHIYLCIALMGVNVLYVWATDSGPILP